eukprot:PhM_4_TR9475/c0_g1_i1/m.2137
MFFLLVPAVGRFRHVRASGTGRQRRRGACAGAGPTCRGAATVRVARRQVLPLRVGAGRRRAHRTLRRDVAHVVVLGCLAARGVAVASLRPHAAGVRGRHARRRRGLGVAHAAGGAVGGAGGGEETLRDEALEVLVVARDLAHVLRHLLHEGLHAETLLLLLLDGAAGVGHLLHELFVAALEVLQLHRAVGVLSAELLDLLVVRRRLRHKDLVLTRQRRELLVELRETLLLLRLVGENGVEGRAQGVDLGLALDGLRLDDALKTLQLLDAARELRLCLAELRLGDVLLLHQVRDLLGLGLDDLREVAAQGVVALLLALDLALEVHTVVAQLLHLALALHDLHLHRGDAVAETVVLSAQLLVVRALATDEEGVVEGSGEVTDLGGLRREAGAGLFLDGGVVLPAQRLLALELVVELLLLLGTLFLFLAETALGLLLHAAGGLQLLGLAALLVLDALELNHLLLGTTQLLGLVLQLTLVLRLEVLQLAGLLLHRREVRLARRELNAESLRLGGVAADLLLELAAELLHLSAHGVHDGGRLLLVDLGVAHNGLGLEGVAQRVERVLGVGGGGGDRREHHRLRVAAERVGEHPREQGLTVRWDLRALATLETAVVDEDIDDTAERRQGLVDERRLREGGARHTTHLNALGTGEVDEVDDRHTRRARQGVLLRHADLENGVRAGRRVVHERGGDGTVLHTGLDDVQTLLHGSDLQTLETLHEGALLGVVAHAALGVALVRAGLRFGVVVALHAGGGRREGSVVALATPFARAGVLLASERKQVLHLLVVDLKETELHAVLRAVTAVLALVDLVEEKVDETGRDAGVALGAKH